MAKSMYVLLLWFVSATRSPVLQFGENSNPWVVALRSGFVPASVDELIGSATTHVMQAVSRAMRVHRCIVMSLLSLPLLLLCY